MRSKNSRSTFSRASYRLGRWSSSRRTGFLRIYRCRRTARLGMSLRFESLNKCKRLRWHLPRNKRLMSLDKLFKSLQLLNYRLKRRGLDLETILLRRKKSESNRLSINCSRKSNRQPRRQKPSEKPFSITSLLKLSRLSNSL